jgi:uncharacterized protein (TIGR02996 family)
VSEAQALLQAILDEPDDDVSRLVYADWLEEHGEAERGELIRLQCRQARKWPVRVYDSRDPDNQRMFELERAHGERWLEELPRVAGVHWWGFWRGFPTAQVRSWGALQKGAAAVWSATPLEDIDLCELSLPDAQQMAQSPHLGRLRALSVNWVGRAGLEALRTLLASPLVRLKTLNLKSCGLRDEGAKVVARGPSLSGLETLWLSCNVIRREGGLALARSRYLTSVRLLDVSRNPLSKKSEEALNARWPGCT